jgi:hypothetical protein
MPAKTDIRLMIEGLRPVADFKSAVERTIIELQNYVEGLSDPMDPDEDLEHEELLVLVEFWQRLLKGMHS